MNVVVHGIQKVDFINDQGERIQGTKLFIGYRDDKVMGQKTDKLFLKVGFPIPKELVLGAVLDLSFDMNRHLEKIQVTSVPSGK